MRLLPPYWRRRRLLPACAPDEVPVPGCRCGGALWFTRPARRSQGAVR